MTDEEKADKELAKTRSAEFTDERGIGYFSYYTGFLAGLKACKEKIELMKCCQNCKHFDFDEPKYCHKGVYNCAYVCDKYELGN